MKQKRKFERYQRRVDGLEVARRNVSSTKHANCYKKNIAGCSLKRVDTSMKYEDNPQRVIQQLRYKHIFVNDGPSTETVHVTSQYSVEVAPKSIYVGQGKEVGNKTRGKLDFLKSLGFIVFGWNDMK